MREAKAEAIQITTSPGWIASLRYDFRRSQFSRVTRHLSASV
jgi:hypothetical protein